MAKEVAKATTTDLMAQVDFTADAGVGVDGADRDSFAIPFLRVLQNISPQVDEIEGARGGMLFNTVTLDLYTEATFLPCAFQRRYIRWADRGTDGSYKGEYTPDEVNAMIASGEASYVDGRLSIDGDRLADTRNHFGLLVSEDGAVQQVILSLSSTQVKKSKQLMSMLSAAKVKASDGRMVTPPTWMNRIKVSTIKESNDKGSWFGVKFSQDGFIDDPDLYQLGKAFHETIAAGEAKAAYGTTETGEQF